MLTILLLPGFVSTILASAILGSSLNRYLDGYFETFAADTAGTGSSDWSDSIDAYGTAENIVFKQDKLNPTEEDPCPRLHCLCSQKDQHFTFIRIDEADPCRPLSPMICLMNWEKLTNRHR